MRAVTVIPGTAGSARLDEVSEPGVELGAVLVEALAVGVCGTDVEIADGVYGWAPPGRERLVLGHESLGRVIDPGPSGFTVGDHVVGIVRRPDPAPCPNCAVGEWDMCSNGLYTERGIKQVDGFMSDRWRIEPEYAVRVDRSLGVLGVLLEPTTVVAKAWTHIAAIGRRAFWDPSTVLVTGAGPIGLLAALIGVQQGAEVHVLDRATSGPKPSLVEALGATYHTGPISDLGLRPDIVVECTGVAHLIRDAADAAAPGCVVCLTGVGPPSTPHAAASATLANDAVLKNLVMFGSVNANRRHYYLAAQVLARADRSWLERLITRRLRPEEFQQALERSPDDIKVVIEFADAPTVESVMRAPDVRSQATTPSRIAVPSSATPGVLSEGPRWDEERGELLWVDIIGQRLHRGRIDAEGLLDEVAPVRFDRYVGAVAPAAGGGYVLAAAGGFLFLDPSGEVVELAQPEAGRSHVRMNDGACDSQGRFWAGTMAHDESPGAGVLYRLELDGTCTTILTGLTISNGIGWSPDGTVMYLSDSGVGMIDAFEFDSVSGDLGARRTIVQITEAGIAPDGLTVDAEGDVWVALWGGGSVRRYSPRGLLLDSVALPVDRPTSCAFGGPDLTTLFVTTARHGLDDTALAYQPDAGRVFRIDGLGARGLPVAPYRGRTAPLQDG